MDKALIARLHDLVTRASNLAFGEPGDERSTFLLNVGEDLLKIAERLEDVAPDLAEDPDDHSDEPE